MGGSLFGWALAVYVVAMFGVSLLARRGIETEEDFLVAGRRLPLWLAWPTLFATWFGAGTLLTATDEVAAHGLFKAALDPFGAGVCLLLAGVLFARRLWDMKLLTVADFYRRRFGARAEIISGILMVPGYCGWIAAQFTALASVLTLYLGLDGTIGIFAVFIVGTGYTLIGGMWSVTLTDAAQTALVLIGLVVLGYATFERFGDGSLADGIARLSQRVDPKKLAIFGDGSLRSVISWIGLFSAGALGNLPGQDLMQRVFSARSANVARNACFVAGLMYLAFGLIPLLSGLAGEQIFGKRPDALLAYMAAQLLSPWLSTVFLLAVTSAVLSTIDSAILSPASVLSQNLLAPLLKERVSAMRRNHLCVLAIAVASLVIALIGKSAYSLLEAAYELGLVSLLVPLGVGLYSKRGSERSALASMAVGTVIWLVHLLAGWNMFLKPLLAPRGVLLPTGVCCAALGLAAYLLAASKGEDDVGADSASGSGNDNGKGNEA
ncbi:MAG: sodium:solute symporter family protein [Myxococcales bacterium]|nr:sodium:solute symporter family protein [Myxococcales bacterium]